MENTINLNCSKYETLKEARESCQCQCNEPHPVDALYYHCAYGNCCGYHCTVCGKFEVVN